MGKADDKLLRAGHLAVGQLRSVEATLERMINDGLITDDPMVTLVRDVTERVKEVWRALDRELDQYRPSRRYVKALLIAAGMAVSTLADLGGAIETVERHGPEVVESAKALAKGLVDLDLPGLDPSDLWIPGRTVPVAGGFRARGRASAGRGGITSRPAVEVPLVADPPGSPKGSYSDIYQRTYQVDRIEDEGEVGEPTVTRQPRRRGGGGIGSGEVGGDPVGT